MQDTHNYLDGSQQTDQVEHFAHTSCNQKKTTTISMETAVLLAPCPILLPQAKRTAARQTACIGAKHNNTA
jgi:hypothetical protein